MTTTHILESELERYALGQLDEEQEACVEEHILLCTQCQDALQDVDEFIQAYRIAATRVPVPEPSWYARAAAWFAPMFSPVRLSYAALAVLVMVAGISLFQPGRGTSPNATALIVIPAVRSLASEVPAGAAANLQLDVRGLEGIGEVGARLIDESKNLVWSGRVKPDGYHASASLPGLAKGDYVLRLYETPANQVAEYAIRVR